MQPPVTPAPAGPFSPPAPGPFVAAEQAAVCRAIETRRDVRSQFTDRPVDDATLLRLPKAVHHAPSVRLKQPWNFIVIRSAQVRPQVHTAFARANTGAVAMFQADRSALSASITLQGITGTPMNFCITCDRSRGGPVGLGRTHKHDMDLYPTVCTVRHLWLAARAENIGVGWVGIFHETDLRNSPGLPETVVPVACLCLKDVDMLYDQPELQACGRARRLPLADQIVADRWEQTAPETAA